MRNKKHFFLASLVARVIKLSVKIYVIPPSITQLGLELVIMNEIGHV
jgi:hypothetical protein